MASMAQPSIPCRRCRLPILDIFNCLPRPNQMIARNAGRPEKPARGNERSTAAFCAHHLRPPFRLIHCDGSCLSFNSTSLSRLRRVTSPSDSLQFFVAALITPEPRERILLSRGAPGEIHAFTDHQRELFPSILSPLLSLSHSPS